MKYLVLLFGALVLWGPGTAQAQDNTSPTVSDPPAYTLKFGGRLGKTVNDETMGVKEGATNSYTIRLTKKPAQTVTVQIDNQYPNLAHVYVSQVVLTPERWKVPKRIRVKGLEEGTVTLVHTITGATTAGGNSITFDVEAGAGRACTYEHVKKHAVSKKIGSIFAPGQLDSACETKTALPGGYTRYVYPFEAYTYHRTQAVHYSHAVLTVDAGHKLVGVTLRNRSALVHEADNSHGHQALTTFMPGSSEQSILSYLEDQDGIRVRKSSCGYTSLLDLFDYSENLSTEGAWEEQFDGTFIGWQRGCLHDPFSNTGVLNGLRLMQPALLSVRHGDTTYLVHSYMVELMGGIYRFHLSAGSTVLGYDNRVFINALGGSKGGQLHIDHPVSFATSDDLDYSVTNLWISVEHADILSIDMERPPAYYPKPVKTSGSGN